MNDGNGAARRKVLLAGAIGNVVEYYDIGLYGLFATTISRVFFPASDPATALISTFAIYAIGFIVRPLGGMVLGHIGDRRGRRFALVLSLILMGASTVVIGLLPGYAQIGIAAPILLLVCRLAQGFSVGGEFNGSMVFVVEHAPYSHRGRYGSVNASMAFLTSIITTLVALSVTSTTTPEQLESWGWRLPFLMAAPLMFVGLYLRRRVSESPTFTALSAEGHQEGAPIKRAFKVAKKPMLTLLGYAAGYQLGAYLFGTFILSHLNVTVGLTKTESMLVYLVFSVVTGLSCLLAGYAIDRLGRKRVAVASMLGLGLWAIPTFALLQHASVLGASLVMAFGGFLLSGTLASTSLAVVELFPPSIRASAGGLANNVASSLFGATAPLVATWLLTGGNFLAPGYYIAAFCAIAVAVAAVGIGNRAQVASHINETQAASENALHVK